jgi:hypothetical protein
VPRGTDGRWNSTRALGALCGSQHDLQGEGEGLGDYALAAAVVLMLAEQAIEVKQLLTSDS